MRKQKHQRLIRESSERLQEWLARLEKHMDQDPDGVIPWIQVNSIMESATAIVYEAGQINGIHFAAGGRSDPPKAEQLTP